MAHGSTAPGESGYERNRLRTCLVVIGGGPSGVSVLAHLAEQLAAAPPGRTTAVEVTLVDRVGETGGGDAFGIGIPQALLLNDSVATIDATGIGFTAWLHEHQTRWVGRLADDADPRVRTWFAEHRTDLDLGRFGHLFLPRRVFGDFMRDRFARTARRLAACGVVVHVVKGEARSVLPTAGHGFRVSVSGIAEPLTADLIVLAPGCLDTAAPPGVGAHPGYYTHGRACDLPDSDAAMARLLAGRPVGRRRVVVLGSAAAASEVIAVVAASPAVAQVLDEVMVVSTSGRLPDGQPSGPDAPFTCRSLVRLRCDGAGELTSERLVGALRADVERSRTQEYAIVDIERVVAAEFTASFRLLTPAQKRRFVNIYYVDYQRLMRHTSPPYASAAARLAASGRLRLVRAGVAGIDPAPSGELAVRLSDGARLTAAAVFDCRGFAGVGQTINPLVRDMVASGLALPNRSGRGLVIDEHLQAAPGLFVMGPLLAGTSRGDDHIWSLKSVARIHVLAARVATRLFDLLTEHTVGIGERR